MSCEDYKAMMMGYIDSELPTKQRQQFEAHLAECEECKKELLDYKDLKEELDMIKFKEPSDAELEKYWSGIYNRLERNIAWILFSIGAIVLLCYGAFELIEEFIKNPNIAIALRIGVVALIVGIVVLFVSVLRERLTLRKIDKYSREVER